MGGVSRHTSVVGHLAWCTTAVDGRPASYGTAGEGPPVLFLHGWALGHQTYKRALKRLVLQGFQVVAPALPGFGGTPNLPQEQLSFEGYAAWVAAFLAALGYESPVLTVGHSFGGAVAVKLAHDHPERVGQLVLVNSIGATTWRAHGSRIRLMAERPLWDWGLRFPSDLWPPSHAGRLAPLLFEDVLRNLVLNPAGTWKAGMLARSADMSDELAAIRARRLPVAALSGEDDRIVPRATFDALCDALGCEGELVPGRHAWMLTDPDSFGEALARTVSALQEVGLAAEEGEEGSEIDIKGAAS